VNEIIDLGNGYSYRWIGWYPDRTIESNAVRYKDHPDLEKACILLTCPHGEGAVDTHPPEYNEVFHKEGWTVVSWEPLTLTPSIHRLECGCHGYITEGKWVG
jgi:hypothetical protein